MHSNDTYLHDKPDKMMHDHFPCCVIADGSGGSADLGQVSLWKVKIQPDPKDQNPAVWMEIQPIKWRNLQHHFILK